MLLYPTERSRNDGRWGCDNPTDNFRVRFFSPNSIEEGTVKGVQEHRWDCPSQYSEDFNGINEFLTEKDSN